MEKKTVYQYPGQLLTVSTIFSVSDKFKWFMGNLWHKEKGIDIKVPAMVAGRKTLGKFEWKFIQMGKLIRFYFKTSKSLLGHWINKLYCNICA